MALAIGVGGALLLTPPARATSIGDAQIVSGEAFLTNDYVEVGSRANGTFGSNNNAPAGYHPRTQTGTKLGFRADRDKDGWGVGVDDGDFFTPGTPYEGWGIQVGNGGTTRWNTNSATAVAGAYSSASVTAGTAEATWASTAPVDGLSVTQVDTVPADDMYLGIDVTLTNTTGSAMSNVYYVRAVDADNCRMVSTVSCDSNGNGTADVAGTTGGIYQTRNRILKQVRDGDALSAVSATQTDGSYVDLRSTETGSLAATGSTGAFCTTPSGLHTFFTSPPTVSSCPMSTTKGADYFLDDLIYQVILTPTLAAGASRTIHLDYFLSAASAGTSSALQTVTFTQPPDVALSDRNITVTASADSGLVPVTFASSTPATCAVTGTTVILLAVGTCTVVATQAGDSTYASATASRSFVIGPAVLPPAPTPADLTSSGPGPIAQQVTATVPAEGTVTLLDESSQATGTVSVTDVGVYSINPSTGTITFTPVLGYSGTPAGVSYRVTDAHSRSGTARYIPTVTKPQPPAPGALASTGPGVQHVTVTLADGETVTLLDSAGDPTSSAVTIGGEGTYRLDSGTGIITFTPAKGFTGTGTGVGFQVTDAYDQTGVAAYTPTMGPAEPEPTPTPSTTPTPAPTPSPTPSPEPLPEIDRKKLADIPPNPKSVTGKERKTKAYNSSFAGVDAYPIPKLGNRQLSAGQATTLAGDGLFDFDSAKLTKKGRAQVKMLVKNLAASERVVCEGYTDYAGDRDHELELSARRAKAVCTALKTYGAEVTTKAKGFGPKRPAVVGGTPKTRKENRRVVVLVTR